MKIKIEPGHKRRSEVEIKKSWSHPKTRRRKLRLCTGCSDSDHPFFEVKEDDLYYNLDLDLYTCPYSVVRLEIKTLDGKKVKLTIPPERDSGCKVVEVRNLGFPIKHNTSKKGDLLIRVLVQIPKKLNSEEKKLFEKLAAIRNK